MWTRSNFRMWGAAVALAVSSCILPPRGVERPPIPSVAELPRERVVVNQLGYLPGGPKGAVWVPKEPNAQPAQWTLRDASGTIVATGTTAPVGADRDSGQYIHWIDFSAVQTSGSRFVLSVGPDQSAPFAIAPDIYHPLVRDALRYFYLNRSGIPLEMPYTEDPRAERPAGHLSDRRAPCDTGQRCTGVRDVSGGWYDAGDYGKYVVNGGVSVWLLLHAYQYLGTRADLATLDLHIPESGDATADMLDEVLWEITWMRRMQETEGPEAGLVHHRVRNAQFTALGAPPPPYNTDPPRYLRDTTTAATLNWAAVGARCARVFATTAPHIAQMCRDGALAAWKAARAHPDLVAERTGYGHIPYKDDNAADEFFWAACELYLTTGEERFARFVERSPYFAAPPQRAGGATALFTWKDTAGLCPLAVATSTAPHARRFARWARDHLRTMADRITAATAQQGYHFPLPHGEFEWGSNSFVLGNALVAAVAHDLFGDPRYLDAALSGLDYVLGRNPLGFSYVSGYGAHAMQFPHHRFFATAYDKRLPRTPPGFLAGGPNPSLADNVVKSHRSGCAPATCYVDDIGSFSTNEVAINWNAVLVWMAAWADGALPPVGADVLE